MANQFLALSLFIMLLSFFIILNALSTFDDSKAAPILNSLTITFTTPDPDKLDVGKVDSERIAEAEGTTLDKIQGLFSAHITGVEAVQNRLGTELRLRLPFDMFEEEVLKSLSLPQNASAGALNEGFFIPTLISLLDTQNDVLYKMDMVAHYTSQDDREAHQELAEKIAHIARKTEEAGLPSKMITAGTGRGPENTVDLYFRHYRAFDPNDFRQAINNRQGGR